MNDIVKQWKNIVDEVGLRWEQAQTARTLLSRLDGIRQLREQLIGDTPCLNLVLDLGAGIRRQLVIDREAEPVLLRTLETFLISMEQVTLQRLLTVTPPAPLGVMVVDVPSQYPHQGDKQPTSGQAGPGVWSQVRGKKVAP